jgi:hypothetical protein
MTLNDKQILNLPNELINEIIKHLPQHPVAVIMKTNIYNLTVINSKTEWRWGKNHFYDSFFYVRKSALTTYDYTLEKALLEVKKIMFIKKYCLEYSTGYDMAEREWRMINNIRNDESDIESDDE